MANKQKAKGTKFETAIVNELKNNSIFSKRIALSGNKDCGDVEIPDYKLIVEAKAHKSITPQLLKDWQNRTLRETENYNEKIGVDFTGVLITKMQGQSLLWADVWSYLPYTLYDITSYTQNTVTVKKYWQSIKLGDFIRILKEKE